MSEQNILSFKNYVDSKVDEEKIIKEKGMSQSEIDSLIDSAEDVAQDILLDDKRKKEERETTVFDRYILYIYTQKKSLLLF